MRKGGLLHELRIPQAAVCFRSDTTMAIMAIAAASGAKRPARKLPACFEINPTAPGPAEPPSDARAKRMPPMRLPRGPYQRENHAMETGETLAHPHPPQQTADRARFTLVDAMRP